MVDLALFTQNQDLFLIFWITPYSKSWRVSVEPKNDKVKWWAMRVDKGAGRMQEVTATGDTEIAAIAGAAEQGESGP